MTLRRDIITAALGILVLTLVFGILYPLVITGISQVAFPGNANGQRVYVNGKPETKDGVPVTNPDPRYFQGRPSATVPPYNAAATTFSNLGPNNVATEQEISSNIQGYISLNGSYYPGGLTAAKVPVDAANSSASGIDPDISIADADIQAYRIAAVRHLPRSTVMRLVKKYTGGRGLGFSGEPGVDVLQLNLALDRLTGAHA